MTRATVSRPDWSTARGRLPLDRPVVVGILNVTPDSFSDGGRHASVAAAVAFAGSMLEQGADVLDVGGESTRPGASRITVEDELSRILPVLTALVREYPDAVLSIDTTKSDVARRALDAGAAIINDVSGLRFDDAMADVVVTARAGLVLMHSRGSLETMASYEHATYDDVVQDVAVELRAGIARAHDAGIEDAALVLDPGLGFGKRTAHSMQLIAQLDQLVALGYPVLVGPSRKRFVGELSGVTSTDDRVPGTIAACCSAYERGARLFRVHDVADVRRALDVTAAIAQVTSNPAI